MVKRKRVMMITIIIICITLVFSGGIYIVFNKVVKPFNTLTYKEIVKNKVRDKTLSYSYFSSSRKKENNKNLITQSFKSFSGVDEFVRFSGIQGSDIKLHYDSNIENGEFNIVLLNEDLEIISVLDGNRKDLYTIKNVVEGKYIVKITGKEAKGNVSIELISNSPVVLYDDNK